MEKIAFKVEDYVDHVELVQIFAQTEFFSNKVYTSSVAVVQNLNRIKKTAFATFSSVCQR